MRAIAQNQQLQNIRIKNSRHTHTQQIEPTHHMIRATTLVAMRGSIICYGLDLGFQSKGHAITTEMNRPRSVYKRPIFTNERSLPQEVEICYPSVVRLNGKNKITQVRNGCWSIYTGRMRSVHRE